MAKIATKNLSQDGGVVPAEMGVFLPGASPDGAWGPARGAAAQMEGFQMGRQRRWRFPDGAPSSDGCVRPAKMARVGLVRQLRWS